MKAKYISLLAIAALAFTACDDDDDDDDPGTIELTIPSEYVSANYTENVATETVVMTELSALTADLNQAENDAMNGGVSSISYPQNLSDVTLTSYQSSITLWLDELVKAANTTTGFQLPSNEGPADAAEGGLLGGRLLDENGLELEQMIQKGSFGAAFYNHAVSVIGNGNITSSDVDKLIEIHGAEMSFDPNEIEAAATYSVRRSNHINESGFFYDIRNNLITAKAAIDAGSAFNSTRDEALNDYLLNWEKSNFATVIYYCKAAQGKIQAIASLPEEERDAQRGSALHSYSEGVGFTHGFRGISRKEITDDEIDAILEKLLAPVNQVPESYRFLNETALLQNLDDIIADIQAIYGFTDEEVQGFFSNNEPE